MSRSASSPRRCIRSLSVLLLPLFLGACPDRASDALVRHQGDVKPTLDRLTRAVAEVQSRAPLAEDTLAYSGPPLQFVDHDRDTCRGLVVPIDTFQSAVRSGDYDASRVYGDRFWSWPLGALAGSTEILEFSAGKVEETFLALKRMEFALLVKTREKTAPKYRDSQYGSVLYDKGRYAGEGWLVDLGTGAVLGGLRFEATNDPVLITETEPAKIQAALELDFEFEIRRAARKALAAKVPSTVVE